MEINHKVQSHREFVPWFDHPLDCLVAEPVSKSQRKAIPKAQAACDKEWNKLATQAWPDKRGTGCWDVRRVREAADVRREARSKGIKMHFGRVAELLYEKGGELPKGHPDRKFKRRCMFLGDNIRDKNHKFAVFDEIGMSPSSVEAGRVADALSLFDGYTLEQSDAVSAYTQRAS